MAWFKVLKARLRGLLRRETVLLDIDEELQAHVEMEIEALIERGMRPEEARAKARKRFGNVGRVKEMAYEIKGGGIMETLLQDVRYGSRLLLKRPGFTLAAIVTLALGIGANTAIFSVVNSVLLRPYPFAEPTSLVAMREFYLPKQAESLIGPANFLDWRAQNKGFAQLVAYRTVSYNLTGESNPERIRGGRSSAGMLTLLGVTPLLGRDFLPEEDQPGREKEAIISYGLWQRRFGADANVIGKPIRLSGENYAIVGVLPGWFQLPDISRDVWTPIAFTGDERTSRGGHYVEAIGRLKPGVSLDQVQAEMSTIARRLGQQYPDSNSDWDIRVTPLSDFFVSDVKAVLWLLTGAVGFVLLIACANVANLLLARATGRQKEIAIRAALGAGRWRIIRQLMTESVLLALTGGLAGWLLARLGLQALLSLAPRLPRMVPVAIDQRALFFTLVISLVTGMLFGLVPALQLSKPDLSNSLKDGGKDGSRGIRIGNVLIVSEVALALVLLIGGGLLLRTFWQLRSVDPGFDPNNAIAITIQLSPKKYSDNQKINVFSQQLLQRVTSVAGVESAGIARILPIIHNLPTGFNIEGRPAEKESKLPQTNYSAVSPDYFKAMGIPLLKGRYFTDHDTIGAPRVAVISRTMADRFFSNEDPIGKRINTMTGEPAFREIVGIVGDVKQNGLGDETRPQTYEPFAQAPDTFMTVVVRATASPDALVPAIRDQVFKIDSEQPLHTILTVEQIISGSIKQQRFTATLLALFAGVALLLAAAGIYGVISYSVSQRTHEIGVRVALGARPRDVLRLVLAQGMKLTLIGLAIGLGASLLLTRLVSNMLFGVTATDPLTFALLAALLLSVAVLASYLPARRAMAVDPLVALRYE